MPIREYECPTCGFRFERIEFQNDPEPLFIHCGNKSIVQVQWSVPADPRFEGPGWAKDGYSKEKGK